MRLHPGEPEVGGWQVVSLTDVVRRLDEASPAVSGRPRIVAVDGRGGAGKTVIVERLRRVVPSSAVVHTDDIAWHQAFFDWGGLLVEGVLRPLHRGDAVDYRPPAWQERGRLGGIAIPSGLDVVWVEGVGVIREELRPWLDASVYIQGDLDVQDLRLAGRDGESPEQLALIASWLEEELPFLLREEPWSEATVVVNGTSDLRHDPDTEVVAHVGERRGRPDET